MFKIKKIILNNKDEFDFFEDYTLIFGPNNVGKSILFKILDFMLGSNEKFNNCSLWELQGMDSVNIIDMIVSNGSSLFFRRQKDGVNLYKRNENDDFMLIDIDGYKELIQSYLIANNDCFDFYKAVVKEKLTYRAFAYLNFIDQYALGNVIHIFPKSTDYRYIKRIRKQMMFIFDRENLMYLNNCEAELEDILKKLNDCEQIIMQKEFLTKSINKEFDYLNIPFKDEMEENITAFKKYLSDRSTSTIAPVNKELTYLLSVSNTLSTQLEMEKTFSKQKELINSRNKKQQLLVQLLKNSIGEHSEYNDYLKSIESVLNSIKNETDIYSMKDYSASLERIESKLRNVNNLIKQVKNTLSEKNDIEITNSINLVSHFFDEYKKLNLVNDIVELEQRKKDLEIIIRNTKDTLGNSKSAHLNKFITDTYLNMPENLSFVKEDKSKEEFSIEFIPAKTETIGKKIDSIFTNGEEKKLKVEFVPGSKARQTCWQIISYIGLMIYAKKEYSSLPILPILVIDGLNEPFDSNYNLVFNYFADLCKKNDIQLIVTSTERIDVEHTLDISNGLNSLHQ